MARALTVLAVAFAIAAISGASSVHAADPPGTAGNPAAAVEKGTAPDVWFKDAQKPNWEVTEKISGGMAQILMEALNDFGSYDGEKKLPCKSAAASVAWDALFNAASAGPLEGFLDAIKSALKGAKKVATFGADPSAGADLLEAGTLADKAFEEAKKMAEDKAKEYLKKKLKEIFEGKPVEVLKRVSVHGNCKTILLAIWDRENNTYEITIYGDCNCLPVRLWNKAQTIKLKTFAVQLKGSVIQDIVDKERVLRISFPKITVDANCTCAVGTNAGKQPEPGGTTPGTPPGGTTPETPPVGGDWSKVKTDCKACQPLVDQILAAQKARDSMGVELRAAKDELDSADGRKRAATTDAERAAADADIAAAKDHGEHLREREAGLIKLQLELFAKLKACEKAKCPPKAAEQPNKPINEDPQFKSVKPTSQGGNADEHSYLPKTAGPGSAIVATITEPNQAGPSDAVVTLVTDNGQAQSYKTHTDRNHKIHFNLPTLLKGAAIAEVLLSKGFGRDGHPDENAARCEVGANAAVPNTDALPSVPDSGPAILRGASAYDRSPGKGIVDLQSRGIDPRRAQIQLDGGTNGITTRAASNQSVEGELSPNVTEGRHAIQVASGGATTNQMQNDVVTLVPHPLAPAPVGTVQPLTVECHGLGSDPATLTVTVSGAAALASGGDSTTVPVNNGVAQVQIRGVRAGAAVINYRLHVKIPGYWE